MIHVVMTISGAKISVTNEQDSKLHWCTLSKPRQERLRSSHASKVRRLLYSLDQDMGCVETEYASGTVWLKDCCISSATRPAPARSMQGRSSVDEVARLASVDKETVKTAWEACFAN